MSELSALQPHLRVSGREAVVSLEGSGPWVAGRSREADLPFADDRYCSNRQFQISAHGDNYWIQPLSDRVPTLLNGEELQQVTELHPGDEIRFATQQILFFRVLDSPSTVKKSQRRVGVAEGFYIGRLQEAGQLQLEHPVVSRRHARVDVDGAAVHIRDLGSTNGTFVNGVRISGPEPLQPGDQIVVGPFSLTFVGSAFDVSDRRGNVRLLGQNLSRVVQTTEGSGGLTILKDANVVVEPREFVAIIGPSGSGKSTLMNALSGREPATSGDVFLNDLALYEDFEAVKRDIAMVPQYNVLHEELTLRQALNYTGRLRLPTDLGEHIRSELIEKVAESVELGHRLDAPIRTLSGGQRKRASLANETLSRPSILFLDEVTSGLDESTDREIMMLLGQLASEGMTIVCVTHTLANIEEFCDKIIVMGDEGVVVFAGPPMEAKEFFRVTSLSQIFNELSGEGSGSHRERFESSRERQAERQLIGAAGTARHLSRVGTLRQARETAPREVLRESIRQFGVLLSRDLRLRMADQRSLIIAAVQSVVIGVLLGVTFQELGGLPEAVNSRSSLMLLLGLSSLWLGCNSASKEIVGDLPVYRQELNVNLSTGSFVSSKFVVASVISLAQISVVLGFTGLFAAEIPGNALWQWCVLAVGAVAGAALGLLISAASDTRDQATTLVPLALVPQFILSTVIAPAMPGFMVKFSEIFVTGYWVVEAMRAVYIETDGPIVLSSPGVTSAVEVTAAASSAAGSMFVLIHAVIFLFMAYVLTVFRNRPKV